MKKFAASLLVAGALSLAAVGLGSSVASSGNHADQSSVAIGWWPSTYAVSITDFSAF